VVETVKALETLGIVDHELHMVAERLKGVSDAQISHAS
jgi:cation transport regulator ChaC